MAQDTFFEVILTAETINDFTGQYVLHHCIDGKIPSSGGGFHTEERICVDFKIPMSSAGVFLLARNSDVDVIATDGINAEALSDGNHLTELFQQAAEHVNRDAVYFDVHIFVWKPHELVTDKAADEVGLPAAGIDCLCDFYQLVDVSINRICHSFIIADSDFL